ncbi:MAG: hypothetical protein GX129_02410 [Clostridiales bacterium]|jgi:hypothetical protein|nr:hypothetical protein [Clostridiales bacterium]
MYATKKWSYLSLGILGIVPISLYLVEADYGWSLWRAVIFTAFCFLGSVYYFIKDKPYKKKDTPHRRLNRDRNNDSHKI